MSIGLELNLGNDAAVYGDLLAALPPGEAGLAAQGLPRSVMVKRDSVAPSRSHA